MTAVLVTTTLSAGTLAGCDSTFQQNARAKLSAQRDIGTRTTPVVEQRTPDVRATSVTLLRDKASTAVVVELRSEGSKTLTDVPITVGVRRGDDKIVLNRSPDIEWFAKHLPSLAAGKTTTWVFRSPPGRGGKAGDEPFARVGVQPTTPVSTPGAELPALKATPSTTADAPLPTTPGEPENPKRPPNPGTLRVSLTNASDVPQLRLPVFAVARVGERIVAAGVATLEELPAGATQSIDVPVTGKVASGATVQAFVTPTIFE